MERVFQLIATDLDGTLIGSANELPLYATFRDILGQYRQRHGTVWAACTGRKRRSFRAFFAPMRLMGLLPEYVILHHAFIYRRTRFGYAPLTAWNLRIRWRLIASRRAVRRTIRRWHERIVGSSLGVRTIRREGDRLSLRFESEESAAVASEILREQIKKELSPFQVVSYFKDVDIDPVPFTKGLALAELAGRLRVAPEAILAIGNGHNDLSMLDERVAGAVGCPSNSEPDVMQRVHAAGGHIARQPSLAGVLEVLEAYERGRVNSALPGDWDSGYRALRSKLRRPSRMRRRHRVRSVLVLALAVYTVLLVFASFGLLPGSKSLMRPYGLVQSFFERLFSPF